MILANMIIQDLRFKIQIYLTIEQTNIQMRNNTKFVNGKDQMKSKFMLVWMAHYSIKSFQYGRFKVLIYFLYVALSGSTLLQSAMPSQYNCLMRLYTNFTKFYFSWKYIFPYFYTYVC